ncbi:MAG: D-2-hydroxyacid dehydrogenase [Acidobacteriia bacterium]|nr:D-2-hydroxyacid dehydrogenase [Terriglobia bacterium]
MATRDLKKMVLYHQVGFSLWNMTEDRTRDLRNLFPDIHFVNTEDLKALAEQIVDADALCAMRITSELFRGAAGLKWIHSVAAGIGGLMIPEVLSSDVFITNARGIFSTVMAEHTLGMILAFSRRLIDSYRFQQHHQWARDDLWTLQPPMGPICGKTLGIIGYGSIGREIAIRARALGMKILALKKDPSTGTEYADRVLTLAQRTELLKESDFVVLALPHTPDTKQVLGDAEFNVIKPGAYVINIGRGKLIDEEALLRALREGRIAGAGLDVFSTEPLPEDHPLWEQPNVLITPHSAAIFPEYWPSSLALLAENIRRFRSGETLKNLVDKNRGY